MVEWHSTIPSPSTNGSSAGDGAIHVSLGHPNRSRPTSGVSESDPVDVSVKGNPRHGRRADCGLGSAGSELRADPKAADRLVYLGGAGPSATAATPGQSLQLFQDPGSHPSRGVILCDGLNCGTRHWHTDHNPRVAILKVTFWCRNPDGTKCLHQKWVKVQSPPATIGRCEMSVEMCPKPGSGRGHSAYE
jgi:hypothetical protein